MKGSLVQLLLLGIIISTLASKTNASRNKRQAGRCNARQQCILLSSCPELLTLLNPPTPAGIRRLQGLTCAFERNNPKVCCDASTVAAEPVVTPKVVTPKVVTPEVVAPPIGVTPDPNTPGLKPSSLLPEQCGSAIGNRIIGGKEVPLQGYGWMALIGYGNRRDPSWGCGGSLISQRYVITAAHCADTGYTKGQEILKIRLGEHDTSKPQDCKTFNTGELCAPPVQDFNPEQIIMHPLWDKQTNHSDDIALIRLDRPAVLHGYVQPICLPPSGLDVSEFLKSSNGSLRNAEVAGWGRWGFNKRKGRSDIKLKVDLPFVPLEKCKLVNHVPLLEKGQVCFGGEVEKDSCDGDSGGSLVGTDLNPNSNKLYVLLGIVSYGPLGACGILNRPAVYTDVAQYIDWIVSSLRP